MISASDRSFSNSFCLSSFWCAAINNFIFQDIYLVSKRTFVRLDSQRRYEFVKLCPSDSLMFLTMCRSNVEFPFGESQRHRSTRLALLLHQGGCKRLPETGHLPGVTVCNSMTYIGYFFGNKAKFK